VGSLSVALALRAMFRHHDFVTAAREAERKRAIADASITPLLSMGGGSGPGVAVSIRF
jgi:hypothetical protein